MADVEIDQTFDPRAEILSMLGREQRPARRGGCPHCDRCPTCGRYQTGWVLPGYGYPYWGRHATPWEPRVLCAADGGGAANRLTYSAE